MPSSAAAIGADGGDQLRRSLGGVDAVQVCHRRAELIDHAVADAGTVHQAQHSSGHRLARHGRAEEERTAEHRLVGAHVVHVGHGHSGGLGEVADGCLTRDVEDLDRGPRDHGEGEARHHLGTALVVHGLEQCVQPARAGRGELE